MDTVDFAEAMAQVALKLLPACETARRSPQREAQVAWRGQPMEAGEELPWTMELPADRLSPFELATKLLDRIDRQC